MVSVLTVLQIVSLVSGPTFFLIASLTETVSSEAFSASLILPPVMNWLYRLLMLSMTISSLSIRPSCMKTIEMSLSWSDTVRFPIFSTMK